jgi:hypothetical protein
MTPDAQKWDVWSAVRTILKALERQRASISELKNGSAALQLGGPPRPADLATGDLKRISVRDVQLNGVWVRVLTLDEADSR